MVEEERWVMHGLTADDPDCIKSVDQLQSYIEEIGFLPLFRNEVAGFSVEEHTASDSWWSEDPERDPWEWRKIIAAGGRIAYGKFFDRKAGFISREWLPVFANYRRDGYDFDARWDDELASIHSKKIMELFVEENADRELYSFEVKKLAGFGGSGEKNFEGEITRLQMQTYLCVRDFRRRKNKAGQEYGWGIAVYCLPEHIWGYEYLTSQYKKDPKDSALEIIGRVKELYPDAGDRALAKVLGIREFNQSTLSNVNSIHIFLCKMAKSPNMLDEPKKQNTQIGFAKGKVTWQPIIKNEIELPHHFFINELTYI